MICLNSDKFISQKQSAEIANVSRMTIWRYAQAGHISTRTNANGVSQYSMLDVCESFGIDYELESEKQEESKRQIVCFSRVSSKEQKKIGALDRQKDCLREYVLDRWGEEPVEIDECVSSFADVRPGLNQLIDLILDGKVRILVCHYPDRLNRQSSAKGILDKVCKRFDVEIVYVEQVVPKSDMQEMLDDVLKMMVIWGNRISASKAAAKTRVDIDDEIIERVDEMVKAGHSIKSASLVLRSENVKGKNGKLVSHHTIGRNYKIYIDSKKRQAILTGNEIETKDSVDVWIDEKTNRGNELKVSSTELLNSWNEYAKANGLTESNFNAFSRKMKAKGFENKRGTNGRMFWHGLSLV